ncbi:MAG TPA: hypothetical protein VHA75_15185, partial [Rugosimonospora sp.]|nr:hypothetical protein [Rugosimonospora sp.]
MRRPPAAHVPGPLIAAALLVLSAPTNAIAQGVSPSPRVIYVDQSALPGGDGSDWLHAFRDLQDALDAAPAQTDPQSLARTEIHVSQGVYRPDRGTRNRAASFIIPGGVVLYGGYGGLRSPNPDQQNSTYFATVLSGDLLGDDGPDFANTADNSYHVVRVIGDTRASDGYQPYFLSQLALVTVRGGNANAPGDDSGAGVLALDGLHISFASCTFRDNQATYDGALGLGYAQTIQISFCSITDNRS